MWSNLQMYLVFAHKIVQWLFDNALESDVKTRIRILAEFTTTFWYSDLSGQFSARQAKLDLIKIQNLYFSYWAWNTPWGNVLSLKSFCQIPFLSWDIRDATFQPAKFVSSFQKWAGNFDSNSWHLVVKFGHNG